MRTEIVFKADNYTKQVEKHSITIPIGFNIATLNTECKVADIMAREECNAYLTRININNGIVVDGEGNEFVWVLVDDIDDMMFEVNCQTCGGDGTITVARDCTRCNSVTHKIKVGKLYATDTGNSYNSKLTGQTYSANGGLHE